MVFCYDRLSRQGHPSNLFCHEICYSNIIVVFSVSFSQAKTKEPALFTRELWGKKQIYFSSKCVNGGKISPKLVRGNVPLLAPESIWMRRLCWRVWWPKFELRCFFHLNILSELHINLSLWKCKSQAHEPHSRFSLFCSVVSYWNLNLSLGLFEGT